MSENWLESLASEEGRKADAIEHRRKYEEAMEQINTYPDEEQGLAYAIMD